MSAQSRSTRTRPCVTGRTLCPTTRSGEDATDRVLWVRRCRGGCSRAHDQNARTQSPDASPSVRSGDCCDGSQAQGGPVARPQGRGNTLATNGGDRFVLARSRYPPHSTGRSPGTPQRGPPGIGASRGSAGRDGRRYRALRHGHRAHGAATSCRRLCIGEIARTAPTLRHVLRSHPSPAIAGSAQGSADAQLGEMCGPYRPFPLSSQIVGFWARDAGGHQRNVRCAGTGMGSGHWLGEGIGPHPYRESVAGGGDRRAAVQFQRAHGPVCFHWQRRSPVHRRSRSLSSWTRDRLAVDA